MPGPPRPPRGPPPQAFPPPALSPRPRLPSSGSSSSPDFRPLAPWLELVWGSRPAPRGPTAAGRGAGGRVLAASGKEVCVIGCRRRGRAVVYILGRQWGRRCARRQGGRQPMTQTSFPLAAKTPPPAPRPAAVGPLGAGRDPQTSSSQGARGLKSGEEEEPEAGSLGRGERAGGGNAWGGGPRGGRGGPGI